MFKLIHILVVPIMVITRVVHSRCPQFHPHHVKITFGLAIMLTGSFMATHHVTFLPLFVWDCLAYSVHGYGALPIIHVMRKRLADLELEEEKPKRKPRKARGAKHDNYSI